MSARTLSDQDMSYLAKAGEWGLLRDLTGWKVCLTGKMSMERTQLATLIEAAGGVFTNTMTQGVQLLIVADDSVWSSKMAKAEEAGTGVLREADFVAALLPTPDELIAGERRPFSAPTRQW